MQLQAAAAGVQATAAVVQLFSLNDLKEERVIHALSVLFVLAAYSRAPENTKVSIYKGSIGLEIPSSAVPSIAGRLRVGTTRWLYGESYADFSQIVQPLSFVGNFYPPYSIPGLLGIYKAAIVALQKIEADTRWTKKERDDIPTKSREYLEKAIKYTPEDEARDRAKIEADLRDDKAITAETSEAEKLKIVEKWYRKQHPLVTLSQKDALYRDVYPEKIIRALITNFEENDADFDKGVLYAVRGQDKKFAKFLSSQHNFGQ